MRYSTEKSMQKIADSETSVGGGTVVLDMCLESAVAGSQDRE